MSSRSQVRGSMSRRRFVALMAAGSAAVITKPAEAAAAVARRKPAVGAGPAMSAATAKELARQKKSTLDTLKTIRDHAMPPGTEPAFVFRALRPARKGR